MENMQPTLSDNWQTDRTSTLCSIVNIHNCMQGYFCPE